jgi:hypothetical protein
LVLFPTFEKIFLRLGRKRVEKIIENQSVIFYSSRLYSFSNSNCEPGRKAPAGLYTRLNISPEFSLPNPRRLSISMAAFEF